MVRSLRELEWREEKEGERGSLVEEACERPCPKRRKRRGPIRGEGESLEPTGCGKRRENELCE